MTKLIKTYQGDRLIKYLHLQAEVNLLLEQLKNLKQEQLRSQLDEEEISTKNN